MGIMCFEEAEEVSSVNNVVTEGLHNMGEKKTKHIGIVFAHIVIGQ